MIRRKSDRQERNLFFILSGIGHLWKLEISLRTEMAFWRTKLLPIKKYGLIKEIFIFLKNAILISANNGLKERYCTNNK